MAPMGMGRAETVLSDDPSDEIRGEPWLSEHPTPARGGAKQLQAPVHVAASWGTVLATLEQASELSPQRNGLGKKGSLTRSVRRCREHSIGER
jgi:hypothetical protein